MPQDLKVLAAVERRDLKTVKDLLATGAAPNGATDTGYTALHAVSFSKAYADGETSRDFRCAMAQCLLDAGASLELESGGKNALDWAAFQGRDDLVELYINSGASIGDDAFESIAKTCTAQTVRLALSKGVRFNSSLINKVLRFRQDPRMKEKTRRDCEPVIAELSKANAGT